MADYFDKLKELLRNAGCYFDRHGKGDHDIWFSPATGGCLIGMT
jgi:hypothetical protein